MTNQCPITPPPELVKQWFLKAQHNEDPDVVCWMQATATQAAQWGADQELEACCQYISNEGEWFASPGHRLAELRAARRPKPPTLKEQALAALHAVATGANDTREQHQDLETIRRAIEALPHD
jgi:hypothetical protein